MGQAAQRVVNERTGAALATRVEEARGAWRSLKGLMFRRSLPQGHGLLFRPARGIHTHFMRFDLDLVFLDRDGRVTKIRHRIAPWRMDFTSAAACIELNAGAAEAVGLREGDRLRFEPVAA
jgi:uncharacterized membrane protein (UPF0127 family)